MSRPSFTRDGETYFDFGEHTYVRGDSYDEALRRLCGAFIDPTVVTAHFDPNCGVLLKLDGNYLITRL